MPEGWGKKNLGDCAFYINGYAFKPLDWKESGVPIIRIEQMNNDSAKCDFYSKSLSTKFLLQNEDLVFSWSATLSLKIWKRGKAYLNQHLFKVVMKRGIDKVFLKYLIEFHLDTLAGEAHGSTMKHITRPHLLNYVVSLPVEIEEQHRIAKILLTVDGTIDKTKDLIEKNKKIKQGLMQDMFNSSMCPDVLLVEEMLKKGMLQEIQDGNHGELHPKSKDFVSEGVPFLMANDINNGKIDFEHCHRITEQQYSRLRIGFAQSGDVLLTHKGTVGRTCIVPKNCSKLMLTPQVTYYRIKDSKQLSPSFLYHFFNSDEFQKQLQAVSAQSTRNYIGIVAQRKLKVKISKSEEYQKNVAKILDLTCSKIDSEESYLQKLLKIKAGLMQDLLSGKVRVVA